MARSKDGDWNMKTLSCWDVRDSSASSIVDEVSSRFTVYRQQTYIMTPSLYMTRSGTLNQCSSVCTMQELRHNAVELAIPLTMRAAAFSMHSLQLVCRNFWQEWRCSSRCETLRMNAQASPPTQCSVNDDYSKGVSG